MSPLGRACHDHGDLDATQGSLRMVLWAALAINATMFLVEGGAGLLSRSVSLQADALDFLGDSASYGLSLFVVARPLRWRASTALLKGIAMGLFGLWVIGATIYSATTPGVPNAATMGSVGALALIANIVCAVLLFRFRRGDANMRSVWLCTRNDALGILPLWLPQPGCSPAARNGPILP